MTRPSDWSALGMSSDPTPGDPDQVQDVLNLINTLATDYGTILDTINKVNGYADTGNLSGATADALKAQMNGRITNFVKSAQTAFTQAGPVLQTYLTALNDHQTTADNLLTQAQNSGLKSTDSTVKGWASTASQAGSDLTSAAKTAASAIENLPGPSDPLSAWEEFLQILGWIALLLILPAMIFGGVLALVEFVVNAVLFVNALVQFAQGNLSIGGLLLALLGVIAPTTRGISLGELVDLVKGMASFAKAGFVSIRAGLSDFMDLLVNTKFTDLLSMETLTKMGNFVLKGGVWVLNGLKDLPTTLITAGTAFAAKLGELFIAGGLKIFTSLRTGSFLSLILPIDAIEVEKLGLMSAFRIGFLERGLGITASPATNLLDLSKLALGGVKTGEFHFAGFGYLDVPKTSAIDINIGHGLEASLPNLNTDFRLATLDGHISAPQISMGNLAAGFTHEALSVGTISTHMPHSNFGLNKLEIPDLRFPKELNNIGNGTVITKMNDLSFVTVHEDKLPANIDMNSSHISVPTLHSAEVSIPSMHAENLSVSSVRSGDMSIPNLHAANINVAGMHTGDMNVAGLRSGELSVPTLHTADINVAGMHGENLSVPTIHTADINVPAMHADNLNMPVIHTTDVNVSGLRDGNLSLPTLHETSAPNLGTSSVHMTDNLQHINIPSLHINNLQTSDLHNVDLASNAVTKMPTSDEMPNLSAIAHTQINVADMHGLPVTQTDGGLKINGNSISAGHVEVTNVDTTHANLSANVANVDVNIGTHAHTELNVNMSGETLHLANPDVNALQHLAANDSATSVHLTGSTGTPRLTAPQLDVGRLGEDSRGVIPPEIRNLQANPEIPVHANDSGIRVNISEAQFGTRHDIIEPATDSTSIPAVSSTGVDEGAAHSAGSRGTEFSEPDLAGKPGLIDPNGEKLAVAWTDFKQAQNLFVKAKADHDLQFHGADPKVGEAGPAFKGKAPQTNAQAEAVHNLQNAAKGFAEASAKLHDVRTNALDLTLQDRSAVLDSLKERPRLLGGLKDTDVPLHVHEDTGEVMVATRALGQDHQLVISFGPDREEFGEVVNVHNGETLFQGTLTDDLGHGGIRIDSFDNNGFREFGHDGALITSERVLVDVHGQQFGTVTIDHTTGGLADLHTADEHLTGLDVEHSANGNITIGAANDWRMWQFDFAGRLNIEPRQLFDHLGNETTGVLLDHENNLAHAFFHDGTTDAFTFHPANDGTGGFRLGLTDNGDVWMGYDAGGHMVGYGMPLRHADGHGIGDLTVDIHDPQAHTMSITTHDGADVPPTHAVINDNMITVTAHNGDIVEVSTQIDHAVLTRADLHTSQYGNDFGTLRVNYGDGTATFRDLPDLRWNFGHDGAHAGFTLTSEDGVHTLSFGGANDLRFSQLTTRDHGTLDLTNVHIRTDHTAGPNAETHTLVDDAGNAIGGRQITQNLDGHFTVTETAPGHYRNGASTEFSGITGHVRTQRTNLQDFNGLHIHEDHVHPDPNTGGATTTIRNDENFAMAGFLVMRNEDGHFTVTDTGNTHEEGNFTEFDGATGSVRTRETNLQDFGGLSVHEDHLAIDPNTGAPRMSIRNEDGLGIGGFEIQRTGDGRLIVTDVSNTHAHGAASEFDGVTGGILVRRTNLAESHGMQVHEDHINLDPQNEPTITVRAQDDTVLGDFQAERDPAGNLVVTDVSHTHSNGSTAEFDGLSGDIITRRTNLESFDGMHIHEDHLNPDADTGEQTITVRTDDGTVVADFRAERDHAGNFVLTDVSDTYMRGAGAEFDGLSGALITRRTNLEDFGGLHVHEDHLNPDVHGDPTTTVRADDGTVSPNLEAGRDAAGNLVVTDIGHTYRNGSVAEFDGLSGNILSRRANLEDFGGLHVFEDHGNLDVYGDPAISVHNADGSGRADFQVVEHNGDFVVTNIGNGHAHGSVAQFDSATGEMHYQQLNVENFGGRYIHEDHENLTPGGFPTTTIRNADGSVSHDFDVNRFGIAHYMVTDTRLGHTHDAYTEFDGLTGNIRTQRFNLGDFNDRHLVEDHLNPDGTGNPAITIRDSNTNAVFGNFRGARAANGHFHVTDIHPFSTRGSHVEFDGATGAMRYRRTELQDFGNLHIYEDHLNVGADGRPTVTVRDNTDAVVPHFAQSTTRVNVVRLTDTRVGLTEGDFAEFTQNLGRIETRQDHLQDSSGLKLNTDYLTRDANNHPTLQLRDDTNAVSTRFTLTRSADGRSVVLTDTAAAHVGETRTFNLDNRLIGARIGIRNAKGGLTPDRFDVEFRMGADGTWTGRWTRTDAGARDAGLPKAYNSSGSATLQKNGTLLLTGADKTPLFGRERLAIGQELEVLKFPGGRRQWTSWDDAGHLTDNGFRRFANDDAGVDAKDVNSWGATIRQYRTGIDGGLVRGEKMPDGSFHWTRFDKDGALKLTGDRSRTPWGSGAFGWKDGFRDGAAFRPAQEHWSAFNFVAHAGHYREHGISGDAVNGFGVKTSFKEVSQQGKDTGSLETIANNHTLEFTRYSEQRIPDFLWKTHTSKYDTVDFPNRGFFTGDSRFQVFSWVEKDAAGARAGHGVRVLTPDGSNFDFTDGGKLVRSTIKLDNGNKIEIGKTADGRSWDQYPAGLNNPAGRAPLNWREMNGSTVVQSGTRSFFNNKTWVDRFTDGAGVERVARYTTDEGDVVHFTSDAKPQFDATQPHSVAPHDNMPSITRNTMGQLIERNDHFGGMDAGDIVGHGNPRTGRWSWDDGLGNDGVRISYRNGGKGAWDDSFADFERNDGRFLQIRDYRALDKGSSLRSWREPTGTWESAKFNAKGEMDNASRAVREWKDSNGNFHALTQDARSPKTADWRDVRVQPDGTRLTVRESIGGKVRIYGDQGTHGMNVWKEYDFGSVWRQRDAITETHPGGDRVYFIEKESFQKQWRMTNQNGDLIRYRGTSGAIMERGTFGQWTQVGLEREVKGLVPALNEFRGWNRMLREPNRVQFTRDDGAVGQFRGKWTKIGQKSLFDFLQDFTIDVVANIIITGATEGWDFTGDQIGGFFAGAAVRSGFKAGYGVLTETWLKDFRDGLRNIDGGKDWNRQPYNNDKHWDNEWAGNENPTRWRSGTFDFFVGSTLVPAMGSFFATLITGSTLGVGKEGTVLSGDALWDAAGRAMAGSLVGGLTVGAVKTLGHVGLSGRWFHSGGFADITLQFGEKMLTDFLVNDLLSHADTLNAGYVAKIVAAQQEAAKNGDGGNQNGSGSHS